MATPEELHKAATGGKFAPAYLFYGVEQYRLREAVKFLAATFLPDELRAHGVSRMDARQTPVADLLADMATMSLLGDRRIIVVDSFQAYKPTQYKAVIQALKPPDPTRLIIFCTPDKVMARGKNNFVKSAFFRTVSQAATPVEFERLSPGKTRSAAISRFKKAGLIIDPEAADLLAEMVAGNRGGFESEVNKLIDYKESGNTISVADVRATCVGYEVYNVFALADQIVAQDTHQVLKMVRKLLADGQSPIGIVTLLQNHFVGLYLAKGGLRPAGPPFVVNRYQRQAPRYELGQIEAAIDSIARTDANLRGGDVEPRMALEMLALELLQAPGNQ